MSDDSAMESPRGKLLKAVSAALGGSVDDEAVGRIEAEMEEPQSLWLDVDHRYTIFVEQDGERYRVERGEDGPKVVPDDE